MVVMLLYYHNRLQSQAK